MASPSTDLLDELRNCRSQLDGTTASDASAIAPTDLQLATENAIAAGVASLAGEPPPEPSTVEPGRSILASDLRITADLVLRALEAQAG